MGIGLEKGGICMMNDRWSGECWWGGGVDEGILGLQRAWGEAVMRVVLSGLGRGTKNGGFE